MSKQDKALQHADDPFQRAGNLTFQPVSPRFCRGLIVVQIFAKPKAAQKNRRAEHALGQFGAANRF
jgi:hypothetical protein